MTRLPTESRDVWGVRGERYDPEPVCAHPFCNSSNGLERHHLYPRSFLRHQPTEWVKLPRDEMWPDLGERIVQNCVYLCREHHRRVTENEVRIDFDRGVQKFFWGEDITKPDDPPDVGPAQFPLNPQPRFQDSLSPAEEPRRGAPRYLSEKSSAAESEPHVHEGQECPTCHRRVPRKRKPSTPTSAVTSFRYPLDEKEQLEEIWEAVAKHLGVYEQGFWKHAAVIHAFAIALQGPGVDE